MNGILLNAQDLGNAASQNGWGELENRDVKKLPQS